MSDTQAHSSNQDDSSKQDEQTIAASQLQVTLKRATH